MTRVISVVSGGRNQCCTLAEKVNDVTSVDVLLRPVTMCMTEQKRVFAFTGI